MFRLHCKLDYKSLLRSFHKAADYLPRYLQAELPETEVSKLSNDVRVVSENWRSDICTVGLWMDIGSRCESDKNNGIAHFLEHMYFKGTDKRDHKTIQSETIEKGASWNTYTSREMISIYANCHKKDLEWAISLLSEIVTTTKYDENLVEVSKENVLKELEAIGNNPREVVFDYIHGTAYQGTPLGRTILGTEENIKQFTANDLSSFVENFFKAPRMVLAAVGDIEHQHLNEMANKYLSNITCNYAQGIDQRLPVRYTASDIKHRDDDLPLGHIVIAMQGPGWASPDNIPLLVAASINGSYDYSYGGTVYSTNNMAINAFKRGDWHSFQNFMISYHDTSLWGIHFTATSLGIFDITREVMDRMVRLCANITDFEVNRAKNQLKGKVTSVFNDQTSICDEIGRQMIVYGRRIPLEEMLTRIDMVNNEMIRNVANTYIYDKCPVIASYGPVEGIMDYNNIRARTYWIRY